ncbi:transcriptional regulator, HxlR family [Paraburkholderia fungorum]|uniref:Transcriptional regulator, HxlR family n=2 Tax=Paraburkholderia fungorum TaxID=134537 RepID=A0A1H1JUT3_9BURK|nr:transcriptional regulator, HxlR family [Paraburkholderia fungorum]
MLWYIEDTWCQLGTAKQLGSIRETTMSELPLDSMPATVCPSRVMIDQIADKWSMLILAALRDGPLRFNAIKRRLNGVTQKALTQCLRRLERNGIVERKVTSSSPISVEYRITALGTSLDKPFQALYLWTLEHLSEVEEARARYDKNVAVDYPS